MDRSLYYYQPHPKAGRDEEIGPLLAQWAEDFPHYGFWMLYHRLRLQGYEWNHKPVYRVYRELGLNIRRFPRRAKRVREKSPLEVPATLNHTLSMDFVSDSLADGRKFRVLSIMDDCSREALAAEADTSLSAKRVIRVLNQIIDSRSRPQRLRVDNGPEFISRDLEEWAEENQVELIFIQPGKPAQNGFVERLNGTIRREVLNRFWFADLDEAREKLDDWIIEYNRFRPHKGLGYLSPDLFAQTLSENPLKAVA
jgi:putative transposase